MTRRLVLVALVVAAWVSMGIPVRATHGAQTTADEPEYLMTALSLAEDRSLDVSDERLSRRYRPFHEALLPVQTLRRADGSRVSPHDPLLPAALAVPMRLGGWVAAKATLALLAGVLAASTLWVTVQRFAVPLRTATVTVLAFAVAPPLAVYATQVYPEIPAALAVVVAIGCLTGPLRRWGTAGVLVCVVALPWLAVKYVPIAAVLSLALGTRLWSGRGPAERRRILVALGVLTAAGVTYLVAHRAWYGGWTVYAAGDHFVSGEFTVVGGRPNVVGRSVRLVGLLVDRHFGLGVWQPLFLAVPVVLGAVLRHRPANWALPVIVLGAGWLNATFVALTMHGFWWPGRQIVVVVPAVVPLVAWWAARSSTARRIVMVGLVAGAANFAWLVVEGWAHRLTWVVDFDMTSNPLVRTLRVLLPDYRSAEAGDWALHGAWIVAVAALVWMGRRSREHMQELQPTEHIVLGSPNQQTRNEGEFHAHR